MSEDEVFGQCFIFLLAGFDTTSNSLSYALYHIAKDEKVRKRLQQEIDDLCGNEVAFNLEIKTLDFQNDNFCFQNGGVDTI
jgi:cytochrome P450 family 13